MKILIAHRCHDEGQDEPRSLEFPLDLPWVAGALRSAGHDAIVANFSRLGWKDVERPKDLLVVSDVIVNVQTGTGNRIEFWDRHGTPFKSKGRIRRFIDVGRLTKGR